MLPDQLREIDRRAQHAGITKTDYMIRKALDKPVGDESHAELIDDLERRLQRLDEITFGAVS